MYVNKGGDTYGFCPGKSTWDPRIKDLADQLIIIAETNWMPHKGGLYDQPSWLIDLLGWFLPKYDFVKFIRKADMILGGGDGKKKTSGGTQPSSVPSRGKSKRR